MSPPLQGSGRLEQLGFTASLAVSGGAGLAPAAFVFMAAMFAGGIPTAFLLLPITSPRFP